MRIIKDVPANTQYQHLLKSLKMNKDVRGLQKYVAEHILPILDYIEKQTVRNVIECLKKIYGRTQIEKLEECLED